MESQGNNPPATAPPPGYPQEAGVAPPSYPPSAAPYPPQDPAPYPPQDTAPYPPQDTASYQTAAPPPAYPVQNQPGPPKAYPPQGYGPPQQGYGPPPGYPGAPTHGGYQPYTSAAGTTTQGYPIQQYVPQTTQNTTTVITQQPGVVMVNAAPPPDNMALSIVSLFCCFFIGIVALLRSIKSRELYRRGDFNGAQQMGMSARRMATFAIIFAVCFYAVIVIIRVAVNVSEV